jgi:hypothetical protein
MARQASSKVTVNTPAANLPPDAAPTIVRNSEVEEASRPMASVVTLDDVKRDLRHLMISQAAYQIYAQRGYVDGFELADWFEAEAEIDRVLGDHTTVN